MIYAGTITLEDTSLVVGNRMNYSGGGIYNQGALLLGGSSPVTNNDAGPGGSGGGIFNVSGGTVAFSRSSRVTGNRPNDCIGVTCPG